MRTVKEVDPAADGTWVTTTSLDGAVRVGRQGIYRQERSLLGYELLFRAHGGDAAVLPTAFTQDQATSQVISATFGVFGIDDLAGGDRLLFVNLTRSFLVGAIDMPCPPGRVVLEVLEDIPVDDELLAGLRRLKDAGYQLAVDDYIGEPARLPLLPLADFVKVDIDLAAETLADVVATCRLHAPQAQLVAERVETAAEFAACAALGFELFQGYYLQRPVTLQAQTVSPSQLVCLRLLAELSAGEASMDEIEQLVASDPGLALRILRTAGSAATGVRRRVRSLRQALVLIGPKQLSAWVILMLLGGVSGTRGEDLALILTRANVCRELADWVPGATPSVAYTVGMLSGVAHILGSDVRQLAASIQLADDALAALLDGEGPCGAVLAAVLAQEADDVAGVIGTGLDLSTVSRAYLQGLSAAMRPAAVVLTG